MISPPLRLNEPIASRGKPDADVVCFCVFYTFLWLAFESAEGQAFGDGGEFFAAAEFAGAEGL